MESKMIMGRTGLGICSWRISKQVLIVPNTWFDLKKSTAVSRIWFQSDEYNKKNNKTSNEQFVNWNVYVYATARHLNVFFSLQCHWKKKKK